MADVEFTEKKETPATGVSGAFIYERKWAPQSSSDAKALIILQHGLHEHCGRYHRHGETLARAGYIVATHDHIGHGQSGGTRGYIPKWENLIVDAEEHAKRLIDEHSGLPVVSMGHSMGGLVAVTLAMRNQDMFSGIILSAPLIEIDPSIGGFQIFMARTLSWLAPYLGVGSIDPKDLSHDADELQKVQDDPIHYKGSVRARTGSEMLGGTEWAKEHVSKVPNKPILILHGDDDKVTNPKASKTFYENVNSDDKKYVHLAGLYHEIFFETPDQVEKVMGEVTEWLTAHF